MKFPDVLLFGGIFSSLITTLILFTKGKYHVHANRLLSIVIFSWGWYGFLYLLIVTGWLREVPHLYRIGSPLYYLIPPCAFLYVRSLLHDETKLRKWDWLHFLPAALNLIDLIPFYLTDAETKQTIVNSIYNDFNKSYQTGSGLLPAFWHFQLRWMQGIIYLVIQCLLIKSVLTSNKSEDFRNFKTVTNWVITFTSFCAFIYVGLAIMSVIAWVNLGMDVNLVTSARSVPIYFQIMGFMGLSVYLFFKPEILYGIPRYSTLGAASAGNQSLKPASLDPLSNKNDLPPKESPYSAELIQQYGLRLDEYMEKHQPFKIQGLTVNELSKQLQMPLHHLSYLINNHYHKRFTDFINDHRIEFIKKRFHDKDWKDYTFEGLAIEAGFISRSNFFTAFKKATGLAPSEYLKQLKSKN